VPSLPGRYCGAMLSTVSYYLRFLSEDDRPLLLGELMSGLQGLGFRVDGGGTLYRGSELLGQLEVSRPGDGLFEADSDELRREARQGGAAAGPVLARLGSLTAILAVSVLWQERAAEQTLDLLSPLWDWLLANRRGLIHADGEGFYDGQGLILAAR
jgi:hypothetical protein